MAKSVVLSFSGGKDSCLALYELQQKGIHIVCLVTTLWKNNKKSVAHEQSMNKLEEQASKLNIPIEFVVTSFNTYKDDFVKNLKKLKKYYDIDGIAFGDIYIEGHREWGEQLAKSVNLQPLYPLWNDQDNMLNMLQQFVNLGFQAKVIKIDEENLPTDWLNRKIDQTFIEDIQKYFDVCPMGESGEYHTVVYDGPIFEK